MPCDFAFPEPRSTPPSNDAGTGWDWAAILAEFLLVNGHTESLFWSLTPRQIDAHFLAGRKRFVRDHNQAMTVAYLASVAPHQKKLPPLQKLLMSDAPPHRQTPEERLAIAQQWTVAMSAR